MYRNDTYGMTDYLEVVYTIEYHLKRYARSEDSTERHQILWHAWNQNKHWLSRLLEWTLPSFPAYSGHDASHADTVLHNIERVLGKERIQQLSATDCFMLLHAAYMHDIGMSITASERTDMMKEGSFADLVSFLKKEGDFDMQKAAESVLMTEYTSYEGLSSRELPLKMKELFQQKLDVYYGLGQIMSEYQRRQHAGKVKERMQNWTMEADKLGNGFSVSGIPLRIYLCIAECASIHTANGIEPVLGLPQEDSGYVLDMMHPRFIAVMLQLGDALDMDNDRFNPFSIQFAGSFPRTSKIHFDKHKAIRQLKITPQKIQIQADCKSQEVLRLVRMECEGIEEILKNASYHWADISPKGMSGCLPTLDQSIILLDRQQVPIELVKAQFNISQVRAFRLLEGANVYGGNFVFIREVIQNAIDASKLQCWEDYIYRSKMKERKILQDNLDETVEYGLNASEKEILSEIDVWEYPIELYFQIGAQIRDENEEIKFISKEKLTKEQEKDARYGVQFLVRDHGTGISKEDLIKISNVGSSYEEKKHFIDKMPDWLKPTGQFGIGLQSIFLIADSMTARTYTRSGEKYEITFNKVSNGSGGYINVKPLLSDDYVTFGTTFEIFLDNSYKMPHADCWEAWNTESEDADRFVSAYDIERPLRHCKEMLTQMILYIDDMLGENLFPIYACIKGTECGQKQYEFIKKSVRKLVLDADISKHEKELDKEKYISWLFKAIRVSKMPVAENMGQQFEEENAKKLLIVDIKDGIGALDCNNAKLYLWNSNLGVFARFGGGRMLSEDSRISSLQNEKKQGRKKTRIYLKGIYVQSLSMYHDSELLELIDIKGGTVGKKHISINRNVFTKEGIEYLEQQVYPALISSAKAALVELNERDVSQGEKLGSEYMSFDKKIMESIAKKTEQCKNNEEEGNSLLNRELEEMVLSAIGLSYFHRILGREKHFFCEKREKKERICKWDDLLNLIVRFRRTGILEGMKGSQKEIFEKQMDFEKYIDHGMLHKIRVYEYYELERTGIESAKIIMDYASLLLERSKVAIISLRHNRYAKWFYVPLLVYEEGTYETDSRERENPYEIFQRKSQTAAEEEELLEKMETWADGILSKLGDLDRVQALHEEYGVDSDVQYILQYMLGNISTVALYTNDSEDGDIRINVLSAEGSGSIFYNKNMKRLILKKAGKLYKRSHAKRFVTTTWRSYECITLDKIPSSVCIVNGAYIARQQTEYMLLPILGDHIGKLINLTNQDFFKDIKTQKENCEKLKKICDDFLEFYAEFENAMSGSVEDMNEVAKEIKEYLKLDHIWDGGPMDYETEKSLGKNYWSELTRHIKSRIAEFEENVPPLEIQLDKLVEKPEKPDKLEFQMMLVEDYFEYVGVKREQEKCLAQDKKEKYWKWFLNAVYFIQRYSNIDLRAAILEHPQMETFKKSLWERDSGEDDDIQKNLINYVMENTQEKLSEKQIFRCYEKLMEDMIESVIENDAVQKNAYVEMLI